MSQRWSSSAPGPFADELLQFAAAATEHWTGAPTISHAIAAGFCARADDLPGAHRHAAVVADLGSSATDRSYFWSVGVRELAVAAIALDDRPLCEALLTDLAPIATTCGVNGAVVAFAGSHGHIAGSARIAPRTTRSHRLPRRGRRRLRTPRTLPASSTTPAPPWTRRALSQRGRFPQLTAREGRGPRAHRARHVQRRDHRRADGQSSDGAKPHHPDLPEAGCAHAAASDRARPRGGAHLTALFRPKLSLAACLDAGCLRREE